MKKIIFISLLAGSIIFLTTGCGKKNNYILEIKESSWSGWTPNYKPEEVTKEYDVVLNKEYVVNDGALGLTFTIEKINKDSITIKTTKSFSDYNDGIDLMSKKTEFTVKEGETLKLTTPTTDAGNIYYFTLKKGK